ncbi:MAG TPA: glycosyltransferase family 39 protein [Candidatus Udaeobacter sp.]|nr:glycosyltransferase family 39 protein [Candidatus Udaeobacter sp.]
MTKTLLEDRRTLWFVVGLTVLLFAVANLPWQLDDYDQAKQAFTSFQMIKEGRWFYQRTPHEHVATKPPLVGWISAGSFAITGSWDMAWRLPSLLAAIAIAMLLFRAAASAYGAIAGQIAFGAFGLNLLSPRLSTLVRTDMPLALVIFLIGLLIWQKIRAETEWTRRERIYLFSLLTVAMLIKGPIVYAFLLPGIGIFEWWRSRQERLDTARRLQSAWPGWSPWIASLAVFLLWVIGGILFTPGFFDQVVVREFVARFGETIHRPQPLYFYLPHLLHKFAPWSVLMIGVGIFDLASRRWRIGGALREMSAGTFWLLCWSLGGLIAMSLIPSKRVDRIFPIVPALCLLLASQVHGMVGALRRRDAPAVRPYLAIALVFSMLFTGGYTIFKIVSGYRDHHDALVVFGRNVRHETEAHHWRYELVSAKDEGLLLYLRKTHFIEPDRAVIEWNRGNLDALVASTEKAPALLGELRDASLSSLKSNESRKEQGRDYVLITH